MNGRVLKSSAYRVNGGREAKTMALEDNVAAKRYREKERCRSSYKREETYYFGRLEATFRVIKRKEHSATDSPRHWGVLSVLMVDWRWHIWAFILSIYVNNTLLYKNFFEYILRTHFPSPGLHDKEVSLLFIGFGITLELGPIFIWPSQNTQNTRNDVFNPNYCRLAMDIMQRSHLSALTTNGGDATGRLKLKRNQWEVRRG